ncbi:MAG: YfhO family protein [Candidatus Melainabacteria bacterium]|nr:YfhO family protein [Candidatus Melainabacteria bacterium]
MPDEPASDVEDRNLNGVALGFRARRKDYFMVLGLVLFVCLLFAKATFAGAALSKIHIIAEWDSAYSKFGTGQSQLMDPSQILLMVPYYLMVGRLWNHLEWPLWNAYSGFGGPLLADPQALALSFLHIPLWFSPTVETYNLILVMELAILAVGGFLLGKALGLSRWASAFLGLTLLLCPYEQWYLELLGNGYCLIPLLFAAFVWTAQRRTIGSAVLAGVAAGAFVLSAHPELSFCSILLSSFLMLLMVSRAFWLRGLVLLSVAGVVAVCCSAPMLFPFGELVVNSDSYKFGNRAPAYYPWQTLAFNLLQPGYGAASPYLGVLATLSLPFGIATIYDGMRKRAIGARNEWITRGAVAVGLLSIIAWVFSAKIYPLGMLLAKKPFSSLVVTYAFPGLVVLIAALAALGFERIVGLVSRMDGSHTNENMQPSLVADREDVIDARVSSFDLRWLGIGLLAIGLFPLLMQVFNVGLNLANFDMTLPSMTLAKRDWIRNTICAAIIVAGLVALRRMKKIVSARITGSILCVCLALGAFSQLAISIRSMPVRPSFSYPDTDTTSLLKIMSDRRAIATGVHTLRPNTNLACGFRDARFHNPIFPARYLAFMERAGAKLDDFNQVFDDELSRMIDLASISLVVTPNALIERKFFDETAVSALSAPLTWSGGLTLKSVRCAVDPVSRAVYVEPTWTCADKSIDKFSFNVSVVNADGSESWISDRQKVIATETDQTAVLGAPIRKSFEGGEPLGIKLSVFDSGSGQSIVPENAGSLDKRGVVLLNFQAPPVLKESMTADRRFKLLSEGAEGIRIYENPGALPEAYVATNSVYVDSAAAALDKISASNFDARNTVVLEGDGKDVSLAPGSFREPEALILRRDSTDVLIQTSSSKPAFLVFTDSWYPGWTATVDGAPASIVRGNYSFRSVAIPAGKYNVQMRYQPRSFVIGAVMALLGFLIVIATAVQAFRQRRRNTTNSHEVVE